MKIEMDIPESLWEKFCQLMLNEGYELNGIVYRHNENIIDEITVIDDKENYSKIYITLENVTNYPSVSLKNG